MAHTKSLRQRSCDEVLARAKAAVENVVQQTLDDRATTLAVIAVERSFLRRGRHE
jgi:hypothetical protein